MTPEKLELMKAVCRDIAEDMRRDAIVFDGRPFNGQTVAEYFGYQGAAIAALAKTIQSLIEHLEAK